MTLTDHSVSKTTTAERWAMPVIFLAVFVVMLPMLIFGIPDGYDLLQHIRFAAAYHDAILRGDIIPAWAGNDNFGYGSIGIRYYPPLAYILLAVGKIFSGSWYFSFIFNSFFWMLAGSVGIYLWAREWVDAPMAVFASILYAIAPYHTFQIYQAVLFAEFAAAGVIPFCFLFLTRLCRKPDLKNAVLFAVACSLLMLTHIPSTLIGGISLGVFAIFAVDRSKLAATFMHLCIAGVATLAATSFHWVKLVTETEWVKHNLPTYYATGYYDHSRYFFPMYWVAPAERYVQRLLWHLDVVVVLTVLFAVPAIWLIVLQLKRRSKLRTSWLPPLAAAFAVSAFMLSLASSFAWKALPSLAKLQFPWRWLLVVTAIGPILFVGAMSRLSNDQAKPGRVPVYLTTIFVLSLALFSLTQNALLSSAMDKNRFTEQVNGMNEAEGCPCWWPVWATPDALTGTQKAVAASRAITVKGWGDESRTIELGPGDEAELRLATFFHPYWKAAVDENNTPVIAAADGAIAVAVGPEAARIRLSFEEPAYLSIFKAVSATAWIALLVLWYLGVRNRRSESGTF